MASYSGIHPSAPYFHFARALVFRKSVHWEDILTVDLRVEGESGLCEIVYRDEAGSIKSFSRGVKLSHLGSIYGECAGYDYPAALWKDGLRGDGTVYAKSPRYTRSRKVLEKWLENSGRSLTEVDMAEIQEKSRQALSDRSVERDL